MCQNPLSDLVFYCEILINNVHGMGWDVESRAVYYPLSGVTLKLGCIPGGIFMRKCFVSAVGPQML